MTGRHPKGQGTGSDTTWEQETTQGPGRGGNRDRGAGKEDITAGSRTHTQEWHTATEGPAPSPPTQRTPHNPGGRTPPTNAAKARIERHTDHNGTRPPAIGNHTGEGGHTCTGRTSYTHRGSHSQHRRAAHHHALTARRRPRPRKRATSQSPEEDEGTATAPRARDRDPQRTGDHSTGPQGGQPHRHLPNPPARAAHQDPHSTDPGSHPHLTATPSHQRATFRPALRTLTRARLTSTGPPRHNTRQHGTPHRTAPQCNATRGSRKHNTPQHDATRRDAAQSGTPRRDTAQHSPATQGATQHGTDQHNAARQNTTRRSTAHHNTPQHQARDANRGSNQI